MKDCLIRRMESQGAGALAGRALLIQLAQGKTSADVAAVAQALGMPLVVFDGLAQRAYPLSPDDSAAQHLVRGLSRVLAARTQAAGLDAALAQLAAAVSNPGAGAFLEFLAES
jgi:hypothetical protein